MAQTPVTPPTTTPLPKLPSTAAPKAPVLPPMPPATPKSLTLEVDYRTGDVRVVGPREVVEVWVRIIEALDSPPNSEL